MPDPRLGEIVLYRSLKDDRDGAPVHLPAIVTGQAQDGGWHLELFAPPRVARDNISHQFGAVEGPNRGEWSRRDPGA